MIVLQLIRYFFFTSTENADLKRRIYYDSILNTDSFLFLIGTNQMNEYETKEIIQDVILPMRILITQILNPSDNENKVKGKKEVQSKKEQITEEKENQEIKHIKQYVKRMPDSKTGVDKSSLENPIEKIQNFLKLTGNFSPTIEIDNIELKRSLEKRNKLFEADRSQTAKSLFSDAHSLLIQDFEKYLKTEEQNPQKNTIINELKLDAVDKQDMFFFEMFETFERAIVESDNLEKIKEREIREFDINLQGKDNPKKVQEMRVIFNLGSVFLAPSIFISISKTLLIPEKDIFIEKMIYKILQPLLTLSTDNSAGTDTEKKENILIFMEDVVNRKISKYTEEIDEAYKSRTAILEKFFSDELENKKDLKIKKIDKTLEKRNKDLLKNMRNTHAESFRNFMVVNHELINSYIRFINTNSEQDKKNVYSFF